MLHKHGDADDDNQMENGKRPPNGHDHKSKPPKPRRQNSAVDDGHGDEASKLN